ncbi:MAG: mismatch-specific DNA-glycosylase [Candidatus Latescibacteria bacterium]|jgi:TDG/mug DNA glycosylase family protein|nr:mismatch-specific DNA-glycosylase [Candidatus Latescibacterota bacterium]
MSENVLPDYLRAGLNLVFVGFNPSLKSAEIDYYYAGRGNQFWPFLFESGLTDRLLTPQEDALVLDYHIGLTDIVKGRATRGIGDLTDDDYVSGFEVLREKIRTYRPRVVCFNGKSGYAKVVREKRDYGLQGEMLEGVRIFLAPSTSGALPMPRIEKLRYYCELKMLIDCEGR